MATHQLLWRISVGNLGKYCASMVDFSRCVSLEGKSPTITVTGFFVTQQNVCVVDTLQNY